MNSIKILFLFMSVLAFNGEVKAQNDSFIGEVKLFAGDFAPRRWALCEGQLLPVSQHPALFSILGNKYGGDGRNTFKLPDLRGRTPIGPGTGPGLSPYKIGDTGGSEYIVVDEFYTQNFKGPDGRSVFIQYEKNRNLNRDPYVAMHYIICLEGSFPSRN
jgi:microcystin-dependent protein